MKALIKLDGEIKECDVTYYLTSEYVDVGDDGVVSIPVNPDFDCLVDVKTQKMHDVCHKFAQGESNLVWIKPTSIFSVVKPVCNVEVVITRDLTIFGWIGLALVKAYRFVKR